MVCISFPSLWLYSNIATTRNSSCNAPKNRGAGRTEKPSRANPDHTNKLLGLTMCWLSSKRLRYPLQFLKSGTLITHTTNHPMTRRPQWYAKASLPSGSTSSCNHIYLHTATLHYKPHGATSSLHFQKFISIGSNTKSTNPIIPKAP